ncbi:polymorphic toxin type 8 domain-containing protein, partial [Chitinophaga cymbidii]
DYAYDGNGNLKLDNNKDITSITYNHLNLPQRILLKGKGIIDYTYDAAGIKLRKRVTDSTANPVKITTTDYMGGLVYEQDTLQFASHEEGRIRTVFKTGQPIQYFYDYFEKDHLGNIRLVLTEQPDSSFYLASMETESAAKENALFSNIEGSRSARPTGYPEQEKTTAQNEFVAKLNGNDPDRKIGPSIVLRVMAGDTIAIGAKAFYKSTAPVQKKQKLAPVGDMAAALVKAFGPGGMAADKTTALDNNTTPFNEGFLANDYQRLKEKDLGKDPASDRPRAYLNFVLFDDQFKMVEDNSGVRQVQAQPDEVQVLGQDKMVMQKSGFLYVYTSNETPQDVYFDEVMVVGLPGPVLEETHYYPFGLTMAGISTKAPGKLENRIKFNGYEQQHREFSDGSGLDWYDYKNRFYDNQVGRFFCVDRLASDYPYYTPYQFAGNEVPNAIDLDGLEPYRVDRNGAVFQAGDNLQTRIEPGEFLYMPQGSSATAASTGEFFSTVLDFVPVVGQIKGTIEGVVGIDLAGNKLSAGDRVLNLVPGRKLGKAADAVSGVAKHGDEVATVTKSKSQLLKEGRSGRQERLRELANDPKESSANRGWIKQEINSIDKGKRNNIRNPPGKELAHERGREAAKGYSYKHSNLQDKDLHKLQHKHDNQGTLNKERPVN